MEFLGSSFILEVFMKNVWRGMLLGLANILPGVSGGTLAISMGIYDKLLYYAGNFFTNLK